MAVMNIILKTMRPFMKNAGFLPLKKCFFRIKNDIAYCIEFEMPSSIMYVHVYLVPLYVPAETRYYTYGTRISEMKKCMLPTLFRDAQETEMLQWCDKLKQCLNDVVFPHFEEISTPKELLEQLENGVFLGIKKFPCPTVWISRLRLFTELYEQNLLEFLTIGNIYFQHLSEANFMTEGSKNYYRKEISELTQIVSTRPNEADILSKSIIEQTKKHCF